MDHPCREPAVLPQITGSKGGADQEPVALEIGRLLLPELGGPAGLETGMGPLVAFEAQGDEAVQIVAGVGIQSQRGTLWQWTHAATR